MFAADALQRAKRWSDAQEQIDAAFALAERTGERLYLPDLWLLRAQGAIEQGDQARAVSALNECVREAREQRALWVELAANVLHCEWEAGEIPLRALADVRARLQEGLGSELVARADALLVRNVPPRLDPVEITGSVISLWRPWVARGATCSTSHPRYAGGLTSIRLMRSFAMVNT